MNYRGLDTETIDREIEDTLIKTAHIETQRLTKVIVGLVYGMLGTAKRRQAYLDLLQSQSQVSPDVSALQPEADWAQNPDNGFVISESGDELLYGDTEFMRSQLEPLLAAYLTSSDLTDWVQCVIDDWRKELPHILKRLTDVEIRQLAQSALDEEVVSLHLSDVITPSQVPKFMVPDFTALEKRLELLAALREPGEKVFGGPDECDGPWAPGWSIRSGAEMPLTPTTVDELREALLYALKTKMNIRMYPKDTVETHNTITDYGDESDLFDVFGLGSVTVETLYDSYDIYVSVPT